MDINQRDKLELEVKDLENIFKNFNRRQTFNLLSAGLISYFGIQFNKPFLEYISYVGFGAIIINAVLYPFLCKEYISKKENLEDMINYGN